MSHCDNLHPQRLLVPPPPSPPPVMVYQITPYTQDIYYNIPKDWLVHNLPPIYMDWYGFLKAMAHSSSTYGSSPIITHVILYYVHRSHFWHQVLNILKCNHIQAVILISGESIHNQPNNNGPNLMLKSFFCNSWMNWMREHVTLKFTVYQINAVIGETWGNLKLSPCYITNYELNKTHLLPLPTPPTKTWTPKLAL